MKLIWKQSLLILRMQLITEFLQFLFEEEKLLEVEIKLYTHSILTAILTEYGNEDFDFRNTSI